MAVPFSQLVAATYDAAVAERGKAANQYAESALLSALEKKGGIKRIPGGSTLTLQLDYRRNPGTDFLATDVTATSTTKTEVLTQASYDFATLVVPITWSITDEILNSSPNQKVDLVAGLVDSAFQSHDDALEEAFFAAAATDGMLSLPVLASADGTGTVGAIDAGTETFWANQFDTYDISDADIDAVLPALFHACAKGSGSALAPNLVTSGVVPYSQFESQLQANQRYGSGDKGVAGFEHLMCVTAPYVYSKFGGADVFLLNTKSTKLFVAEGGWRKRTSSVEHVNAAAMTMKVVSVCQIATNNRSRMGRANDQA
jgi:hypothetical protein